MSETLTIAEKRGISKRAENAKTLGKSRFLALGTLAAIHIRMSGTNNKAEGGKMSSYDTAKLHDLGYGDDGSGRPVVDLTAAEVAALAEAVGGTVEEIESARI